MVWIRKYRPKSLKEFVNQKEALQKFLSWVKKWKPGAKAALLYGPPGTGKTCLVEAYAKENNLDLIQLNASDERTAFKIERIVGNSALQASLFRRGKIFLIDEIDGISAKYDKGAIQALIKIIQTSKYPLVFTANDPYNPKLAWLRQFCELIEFKRISIYDIQKRLEEICKQEGIKVDKKVLRVLANKAEGDLRSGINDLEVVARGKKEIKIEDLEVLGFREREEDIFRGLGKVFKLKNYWAAKMAFSEVTKDPDEIFWWLEENITNEYEKIEEIAKAYEALAKADIFRRRILLRQNWRMLAYMNDLMCLGVAFAKLKPYKKFTKFKPPARIKLLASTKAERKEEKEILQKWAAKLHCSTRKIKESFLPYLGKLML